MASTPTSGDVVGVSLTEVADVLRLAPRATPWRLEGPARAAIRAMLCLGGDSSWPHADRVARTTVQRAREAAGAPEPEGWDTVNFAYLGVARDPVRVCEYSGCGKPNPRSAQSRFCSSSCKFAAMRRRLGRVKNPDNDRRDAPPPRAVRPSRPCSGCGEMMPGTTHGLRRFCDTCRAKRANGHGG